MYVNVHVQQKWVLEYGYVHTRVTYRIGEVQLKFDSGKGFNIRKHEIGSDTMFQEHPRVT